MAGPDTPDAAAERVAAFLIERTRRTEGRLWDQGPRKVAIDVGGACAAGGATPCPALVYLTRRRLRGVPEAAVHGLLAWARGQRPVFARSDIPSAAEMLRLQAAGRRCVSLLDDGVARDHGDPRHPDGRSFVIHDLCHLEKFVDPAHHRGQVGFFATVANAYRSGGWRALESDFDDAWRVDRDYVFSDMNGSAIFLFAALKMKIKMAVRRALARRRGLAEPMGGPFTPAESAALAPRLDRLFLLLDLTGPIRNAAQAVSTRRDDPDAARLLLATFESRQGMLRPIAA